VAAVNGETKIEHTHRDRLAVVYLRQSSMAQVREHTESTMRQYGLAEEAVRLGWARTEVLVIDTDLGVSGRWGVARAGFTELVGRVCSGEVGAIFGIEISRLARSNAEVARLMEFATITGTLLIDADGVYDPRDVNDRMLLGMKSTIGEVELHVMAQRLQASKKAAAARGELRTPLPVGYVPMPRSRPRSVTCSPPSLRAARPTGWSPRSPIAASRYAPTAGRGPASCAGAS
jgi:DNA invertase Pin-like site-specific DNA recombinase